MELSWDIVAAVLGAAALHAGWNALIKSSTDKALDTAVIHLTGSLLGLPLLAFTGLPPAGAWPWIAASVLIHVGYFVALAGAYQHGDLGLTYPLMRGVAPVLVALSAGVALGEALSALAWSGVLAVCGGVLLLGLSRRALTQPRAVAFALANAMLIAAYTLVDAHGVRATVQGGGHAWQYVVALFMLNGWPFALIVLARRGPAVVLPYARQRLPWAVSGAAASLLAYGIALWAMSRAPVASVAALRETSVLFAALLGHWLLNEPFTRQRLLGTLAIVVGVLALRLG